MLECVCVCDSRLQSERLFPSRWIQEGWTSGSSQVSVSVMFISHTHTHTHTQYFLLAGVRQTVQLLIVFKFDLTICVDMNNISSLIKDLEWTVNSDGINEVWCLHATTNVIRTAVWRTQKWCKCVMHPSTQSDIFSLWSLFDRCMSLFTLIKVF